MRRFAILPVSGELILHALRGGHHNWLASGIPDDATVVGASVDLNYGNILLTLASNEFAECPEGFLPPVLDARINKLTPIREPTGSPN